MLIASQNIKLRFGDVLGFAAIAAERGKEHVDFREDEAGDGEGQEKMALEAFRRARKVAQG